jgi:hypothetical protein
MFHKEIEAPVLVCTEAYSGKWQPVQDPTTCHDSSCPHQLSCDLLLLLLS